MWWRAGLAAVAAMLLVPAHAPAQAPALAGVNQISGDRSGYLDVRIPNPVRVSFDYSPSRNYTFAITSKGFAGVMLRRLNVTDDFHTVVAAARFEPEMLCGCDASEEKLIVGIDGIEAQASAEYSWQIPAGDYRLYLLTDGRPANVRITLAGLSGSRVLHPEHGVQNPVPEGIPPLSTAPGGAFTAFARGETLGSRGALLWGAIATIPTAGHVEIDGCSHAGSEPVTTIFAPACPGGTWEGGYGYTYAVADDPTIGAGFVAERDSGDWSIGGSFVGAGTVGPTGWVSVVLPFRGNGTRIAPPEGGATAPTPEAVPQSQDAAPGGRPSGRARLLTRSARVRRGRVAVRIGCSGGGECAGSLRLGRARPSPFSVPAGRSASVRLAVPAALARRVQRRGRAVARLVVGDQRTRLTLRR